MQFNKVLINPTPHTILHNVKELSVIKNLASLSHKLSSEKATNTKQSWTLQLSVLILIAVHYFHMNIKEPELKGLSEDRFSSMIFLLRMAGIPLKMKKISNIYALYMITVIISFSTTYLGMFIDVYVHREDLGLAMTTMRALFPFTNVMWMFSYCM